MTRAPRSRAAGTTLLKIARCLFTEQLLSAVVLPTISDLQREVAEARSGRASRLRAHCRGYGAFWKVMLIAPFAPGLSPASARGVAFADAVARLALASIALGLLAIAGPLVDAWASALFAAAALFAIVIHWWYRQHPSALPAPPQPRQKASPQINFSSTEVDGNMGGLIFAVGSVVIVSVGLPSVISFLFTAVVGGCVVAWGLTRWRISHPHGSRPAKGIVLR